MLDISKETFEAQEKGLSFKIWDWDPLGGEALGQVSVPPKEIIEAKGERVILKLLPPDKSKFNPGALFGTAAGALGSVGGALVGGVGQVGGSAAGFVGKGVKKAGSTGVGKFAKTATKPMSSAVQKGGGAVFSGVRAGSVALVSGVKSGAGTINQLNPLASKRADDDYGYITIRCREATSYDKKFMKFAKERRGDFLGCRQNNEFIFNTKGGISSLLPPRLSIVEKSGPDAGVEKVRGGYCG